MNRIYCADGNPRFAAIAVQHGFKYGAQLPNTVYFAPYFCDQSWRTPNRPGYMAALNQHQPALATVLDLERADQFGEVLSWAREAAQYVSEAVIIIPKVRGIVKQLPREICGKQVRLGYSVPTRFAGTSVSLTEFIDWPVHLLGGSPTAQLKLAGIGERANRLFDAPALDVWSADGNYAQAMALRHGNWYAPTRPAWSTNGEWPRMDDLYSIHEDMLYHAFRLSCINIQAAWQRYPALIRYATEADLPQIKTIANQYKQELGYVMLPALRKSMAKLSLFVAESAGRVVGFVNYWPRRDGWQTIYEIAVHRDWRGQGMGKALLLAVPGPIRLKTTMDNYVAMDFYKTQGFEAVKIEDGRKRKLQIMERNE